MENCLVTKLKSVVDNSNLQKIGALELTVTEKDSYGRDLAFLHVASEGDVEIEIIGEGSVSTAFPVVEGTKKFTKHADTSDLYFSNGNYRVILSPRYKITELRTNIKTTIIGINLDKRQLSYMDSCVVFRMPVDSTGDIKNISLPSLSTLQLSGLKITGDIGELAKYKNLTCLRLENTNVYGNLSSLAPLVNLSILSLTYSYKVTGALEDFVAGQIAAGRATVTADAPIDANGILRLVTFGGKIRNSTFNFITWDSASKITVYEGANTLAGCNTIIAKGATQEEIAAWENAGKTVVKAD